MTFIIFFHNFVLVSIGSSIPPQQRHQSLSVSYLTVSIICVHWLHSGANLSPSMMLHFFFFHTHTLTHVPIESILAHHLTAYRYISFTFSFILINHTATKKAKYVNRRVHTHTQKESKSVCSLLQKKGFKKRRHSSWKKPERVSSSSSCVSSVERKATLKKKKMETYLFGSKQASVWAKVRQLLILHKLK